MAYTYAYTATGTILRSDGAEIPNTPGNAAYDQWRAFEAGGGTTTPAASITLDDLKEQGIDTLNKMAADQRRSLTQATVAEDLGNALRYREAERCQDDPSPENDNYPMIAAEIPAMGATLELACVAIYQEGLALREDLGAIEAIRREAIDDINAAANGAAIDAILAAIDWTP